MQPTTKISDTIPIFRMGEESPQTAQKRIALNAFVVARLEAHRILSTMLREHGEHLPDLCKAQGLAAAALAGLKFHRVAGEPNAEDILAIRDDLEIIAGAVDPLIEQLGREASVDLEDFTSVIFGAIDGNATHVLDKRAEKLAEARD